MPWRANGECQKEPGRSMNWYPEPGDARGRALCKAVCRKCPVKSECLAYALDRYEYGVWGGTSERERKRMRKSQNVEIVVSRINPDHLPENVVPLRLPTAPRRASL